METKVQTKLTEIYKELQEAQNILFSFLEMNEDTSEIAERIMNAKANLNQLIANNI